MVHPYQSEILGLYCRKQADSFRPAWRFFVPHAYAAIEGMREPSEGMINAGWRSHEASHGGDSPDGTFSVMIDAALTESPDAAPPDPDPA